MGLLEDLAKFGQDAAGALDQATRNTLSLAGSGVNAQGRVIGPAADMFGSDPTEFILNVARKTKNDARTLLLRVANRTGKLKYVFATPQGQRSVTARPPTTSNANQIALTLALAALDAPATMIEEAGRMATGQGEKARGLQGYSVYPMGWPTERGLEPISTAAILAIVIPIIAAIAAAVLPALISAAANVIADVTGGNKPTPEQQAAAAEAAQQRKTEGLLKTAAIVGAVVLVLGGAAYALTRKRAA